VALAYYAAPGPMTDLTGCSPQELGPLPTDPVALCRLVQGLLVHEELVSLYGLVLDESRRQEVRARPAAKMVEQIQRLGSAPLVSGRPPEARMIANCRHFSTLSCALLRSQGHPARARCGFADYFEADKYVDHWVVEYWEAARGRWVRCDSQLDGLQRDALKVAFDSEDMPSGRFLPAGEAWRLYRSGNAEPDRFGIFDMWGPWFIANNVVRDLAALNKMELLPWDSWGMMTFRSDPDAEGRALLDEVATVIASDDMASIGTKYEGNDRLRVQETVFDGRFGEAYILA
jgi:hypothetical protein